MHASFIILAAAGVSSEPVEPKWSAEMAWTDNGRLLSESGSGSSPPPSSDLTQCTETCNWAADGGCDDGGLGADYTACDLGSDCTDCGPRTLTYPTGHMWAIESGAAYCQVSSDGMCVTDGTGNHGSNEACVVRATQALYATATFFSTETYWDSVTIGSFAYSGLAGPTNAVMNQGDAIRWSSDGYGNSGGFVICASSTPLNWIVESGSAYCSVSADGLCVTDGDGNYGASEACTVRAAQALYVTATEFNTENYWDSLTIAGAAYSGTNSPFSVPMALSDTLVWSADSSGHGAGEQLLHASRWTLRA